MKKLFATFILSAAALLPMAACAQRSGDSCCGRCENAAPSRTAPTGVSGKQSALTNTADVRYTCPMHPEVIQSSPGECPKCGMDLVRK